VGPRTDVDGMENRKDSCPYRESNPSRPVRSQMLHTAIQMYDTGAFKLSKYRHDNCHCLKRYAPLGAVVLSVLWQYEELPIGRAVAILLGTPDR
jgi:hypothetical protein